jgi:hypothetical protein
MGTRQVGKEINVQEKEPASRKEEEVRLRVEQLRVDSVLVNNSVACLSHAMRYVWAVMHLINHSDSELLPSAFSHASEGGGV